MDEIREEVEEWVMDPDTMAGRASVYEQLMMLYWVMKNLIIVACFNRGGK